ncbi:Smr/MutS family protein [Bartonella sp. MM73XJBT]|uniref:Smr/MutS family protein n=1 Tax=Bartonella sp. MM73XJBT TaxID=3019095 RepID=UPI0023630842|nr:Smr/MutS family protein [Bartonella sp. MM73XJBT]
MSTEEWRRKKEFLTPQDRLLWERVCRTIRPLHGKLYSSLTKDAASIDNAKQRLAPMFSLSQENTQKQTVVKTEKETLARAHKIHFFDRAAYRKIAKGHYPIEARLDLHGCMQEEAYFFLKKFLQSSQQNGLRYVLVITGKGRSPGSAAALYKFVPHWLSTPTFRYYVHAFEQAARQHGGGGALYIWLRRFALGKGHDII